MDLHTNCEKRGCPKRRYPGDLRWYYDPRIRTSTTVGPPGNHPVICEEHYQELSDADKQERRPVSDDVEGQIGMWMELNGTRIHIPSEVDLGGMVLTGEHRSCEPCLERPSGCTTTLSGTFPAEHGKGLTYQLDWDESHGKSHYNLRLVPRIAVPGKHMALGDEITDRLPREVTHVYASDMEFAIGDNNREILRKKFFKGTTVSGTG